MRGRTGIFCMWDWKSMTCAKWARYIVLAVVLADCVGIYYANRQLNQPWRDPAEGFPAEVAVEQAAIPGDPPEQQSAAKNVLALVAPVRSNSLYDLPAYMPVPAAVKNELPVYVEPAGEFVLGNDFDRPKTARLQPPKAASRRFVSAFAADLAQPPAAETALPVPSFRRCSGCGRKSSNSVRQK